MAKLEQELQDAYAKTVIEYKKAKELYPYTIESLPQYFFKAGAQWERERSKKLILELEKIIRDPVCSSYKAIAKFEVLLKEYEGVE